MSQVHHQAPVHPLPTPNFKPACLVAHNSWETRLGMPGEAVYIIPSSMSLPAPWSTCTMWAWPNSDLCCCHLRSGYEEKGLCNSLLAWLHIDPALGNKDPAVCFIFIHTCSLFPSQLRLYKSTLCLFQDWLLVCHFIMVFYVCIFQLHSVTVCACSWLCTLFVFVCKIFPVPFCYKPWKGVRENLHG